MATNPGSNLYVRPEVRAKLEMLAVADQRCLVDELSVICDEALRTRQLVFGAQDGAREKNVEVPDQKDQIKNKRVKSA